MNAVIDTNIVSVRLLGKSYNIKCPPEQAEALQNSAKHLENKLRDMKKITGSADTDRLLVVMALNLYNELSILKAEKATVPDSVETKLQSLQNRIQSFLSENEEDLINA